MTVLCFSVIVAGGALVWAAASRRRQYRYGRRQDYRYDFETAACVQERVTGDRCRVGEASEGALIARCFVKSGLLSMWCQPFIETVCGDERRKHYFEHGAGGVRYIDLTGCRGEVVFRPRYCRMQDAIELYRFEKPLEARGRVLVLAPHADDAEIAAFGLYDAHDAYVVTVTAGEEGKCDYCGLMDSKVQGRRLKGLLRTHDALHIPAFGGVGVERCAALGYFGMTLKRMFDERGGPARSVSADTEQIDMFRRTSHAGFIANTTPEATWDSLVRDLQSAIETLRPDVVVTPHPQIDANSDHRYTSVALAEAMEKCAYDGRVLAYDNHHALSEAYPYGPMFSATTLPPWFDAPFACEGIYSYRLPHEVQVRKFFALEAMHDLRDPTAQLSLSKSWKQVRRLLKRTLGGRDKSYFRRGVRDNELFYVFDAVSFAKAIN